VTNAYFAGRCDAFGQDRSALASVRARAPNPADHVVLSEVISKAPLGPAVMPDHPRWIEIVRWSVYALINAEELGLGSKTIDGALDSDDPDVRRFVGKTDGFGAMLGLDEQWAFRIVKQVGN
jgi:general L-amino acid transport system substrate-binding protein